MNVKWVVSKISRHSTDVVVAYLIVYIAEGAFLNPLLLAQTVLAIKLNVFAIPLGLTPVIALDTWMWYVVVVMWLAQMVHWSGFTAEDVIQDVNEDLKQRIGSRFRPDHQQNKTSDSHQN